MTKGTPWADDDAVFTAPPNAFAARILCEKHNSALSVLDREAKRLFCYLCNLNKKPEELLVDGVSSIGINGGLIEL